MCSPSSYDTDPLTVGDLVICAPVVAREAAERGRSLAAQFMPIWSCMVCFICRATTTRPAMKMPGSWRGGRGRGTPSYPGSR